MNSELLDEDSINVDELQAQIDLSMSFAHSLVSSWVKPRPGSNLSRRKEREAELLESMRRPPRLGVGATVSETAQHASREAARLKGQLVGKKRAHEDSERPGINDSIADDEESRAGAIKKKAKIDPFNLPNKKKKKKQLDSLGIPDATTLQPLQKEGSSTIPKESADSQAADVPGLPLHGKTDKKQKETTETLPSLSPKIKASGSLENSNQASPDKSAKNPFHPSSSSSHPDHPLKVPIPVSTPSSRGKSSDRGLSVQTTKSDAPLNDDITDGTVPSERPKPAYLALVASVSSPQRNQLLSQPLLNLHEISDDSHSEDEKSVDVLPTSPKKKRRRRKRKKKHGLDETPTISESPKTTLFIS